MKYIIFSLLFSHTVYAKNVTEYVCNIDKDIKVELSLLDAKNPSVSLIHKNAKFGLCFFETPPTKIDLDKKAVNLETLWNLELKKCTYYSDKLKSKLSLLQSSSFKQSAGKTPSYFQLLTDQQPLFCTPKT
ncbi:hypothetical protein SHI21_19070 [Bacteriovorax sp. PP10]|uniref:Uncharacterized protein n=1 Tax=Bacteriovorax antarcticus TaxID=3088717 RepID=A0ABU5VZ54_9BACT|nr:hypothetical protein [Bacteriovorax sp. PP10]MEA9358345.1 hypothetical protein [Bacteriovorax sp. PP10]